MGLYVDATALIALGGTNRLSLLRFWPAQVVITPQVRNEVKSSAPQIDRGFDEGWLRLGNPPPLEVEHLMSVARLDRGEAETIQAATTQGTADSKILIDEARAFRFVASLNSMGVSCLAQVLHELEDQEGVPSCRELMALAIDAGAYGWAKNVRQHDEAWCEVKGIEPV